MDEDVRKAAADLLDLIYDVQHKHLHLVEGNEGDYAPMAGDAARRLADAINYAPKTRDAMVRSALARAEGRTSD